MVTAEDLKNFFERRKLRMIIAADAEPRVHQEKNGGVVSIIPAGGVSIALDPIAQISQGVFIARAKTGADKEIVDRDNNVKIQGDLGSYTLKRIFIGGEEEQDYYNGFSNQTLWPLCHVAFQPPIFENSWYISYTKVNQRFAKAIGEASLRQNSFIWVHDYQLALVPKYLDKPKDAVLGMFWHIPWPTWEAFRILPQKREILESMLSCDFLAFHRGYHVRNFLDTVRREFEVRIDEETNKVYYNKRVITVKNLPMGIDSDVIKAVAQQSQGSSFFGVIAKALVDTDSQKKMKNSFEEFFKKYKVIIGIDRLDYTKGLTLRLKAIEKFLNKYPQYIGKIVYVGIIAPSRETVPAYKALRKEIKEQAFKINLKYARKEWVPIHLIYQVFTRKDVMNFYKKSQLCLVTPLDDGMNLVSKEFVIAASSVEDPGMLVLSQFAGSAIDLTSALIINPYNVEEVAIAIKDGLEMKRAEKLRRMKSMAEALEDKNIYAWTEDFVRAAIDAAR